MISAISYNPVSFTGKRKSYAKQVVTLPLAAAALTMSSCSSSEPYKSAEGLSGMHYYSVLNNKKVNENKLFMLNDNTTVEELNDTCKDFKHYYLDNPEMKGDIKLYIDSDGIEEALQNSDIKNIKFSSTFLNKETGKIDTIMGKVSLGLNEDEKLTLFMDYRKNGEDEKSIRVCKKSDGVTLKISGHDAQKNDTKKTLILLLAFIGGIGFCLHDDYLKDKKYGYEYDDLYD